MSSATGILSPEVLATYANNLRLSKYVQLAAFAILAYDHGLTFNEEIERIWKQPMTGASILFLLNRYIAFLRAIVVVTAYHHPQWTGDKCSNFVRFIGASSIVVTSICGLLMILRVYALYRRSNIILIFLASICIAQLVTSAVGISNAGALQLPPGPAFVGCLLTATTKWFAVNWAGPLFLDGAIFFLTLWRTREYILSTGRIPVLHVLVRDGTLYFLVIFLVNLVNAFLFFLAPNSLKSVATTLSVMLTSVMVSRLVLNLRLAPAAGVNNPVASGALPGPGTTGTPKPSIVFSSMATLAIGNLGQDVETHKSQDRASILTNSSHSSRNLLRW